MDPELFNIRMEINIQVNIAKAKDMEKVFTPFQMGMFIMANMLIIYQMALVFLIGLMGISTRDNL